VVANGVEFWLIDRPNGVGVRVKDPNAETLKNFKGLTWFPVDKSNVVVGKWKDLNPPKTIRMPDILGNSTDEALNGSVVFKWKGKDQELYPSRMDNQLFFVFKDTTSGKSTYGPGRFLGAEVEADGTVKLDFNLAYNPPCAVTNFATCPLPPAENVMKVAVEAGEKAPAGKH